YRGLIVGSPTYSLTLYPEIEAILSKITVREVKNRIFGYFGSFTWASVAVKKLKEFADNSGFQVLENSVEMKQAPTEVIYAQCKELADEMADKLLQ
ncbi:MAG: FprA family A-type flavoprotein, partial [Bacteroidaceae bacterium]|nr:FprA family A-type flavoprotein [Bacteroidaceae bacterium]